MPRASIFSSFLQAGFECSTHTYKDGRRLDVVYSSQHDKFVDQDYSRLREVGFRTVREGLRWHLIETRPGKYDFSSAHRILETADKHGIQIIWDGLHFGWPDFLDVFTSQWVDAFAAFMHEFAGVVRAGTTGDLFIAPVNEISFLSWAGGDMDLMNPFCKGRGNELKRQLVRGSIAASRAIRRSLPYARLVSPEPAIHVVGDPSIAGDVEHSERYRTAMFQAWDMVAGRLEPELGGDESLLDIIGVNFYDRDQWWSSGTTIRRHEPQYRPFREILREIYERYRRPIFVSETGTEDDDRADWFRYVCDEAEAAISNGVEMAGVCLYPILNHPGWEDDRHCCNGLWDYASPSGERESHRPLESEIRKRIESQLKEMQWITMP